MDWLERGELEVSGSLLETIGLGGGEVIESTWTSWCESVILEVRTEFAFPAILGPCSSPPRGFFFLRGPCDCC